MARPYRLSWEWAALLVLLLYPVFPVFEQSFYALTRRSLGAQMPTLFTFAVLALALNVVVGYTGLLHLGIAAFFGIGAYVTGILTVPAYPFETGFWVAIVVGTLVAAGVGALLAGPSLRLRGDYLALVTLGFGEVAKYTMKNLGEITGGVRGLNPVPAPVIPGVTLDWADDFRPFYYLTLGVLALTYILLGSLERSRLGRAWVALREDELAATCMGLNPARLKLAAFILSAGLAGLAGCLFAAKQTTTSDPNAYDFSRSIFILCCLILGGLGSRPGVVLGVFLLYGFDGIASPILDSAIQQWAGGGGAKTVTLGVASGTQVTIALPAQMFTFTGWRLIVFGVVLILVMRYRPEGLVPSERTREEMHPKAEPAAERVEKSDGEKPGVSP